MNTDSKYNFSFTGAAALIAETRVVAEEFSKSKDWDLTINELTSDNRLNKIKQATFKRQLQELKKRITLLTLEELEVLVNGNMDEAKAIVLISLVKAYPLFHDFILEVVRTKYFLFDKILKESDYLVFIHSKSISHAEIASLKESTAKKVKQRVFTMLEQVGLILNTRNGTIIKPFLSQDLVRIICADNPDLFKAFLFSNEEIKTLCIK